MSTLGKCYFCNLTYYQSYFSVGGEIPEEFKVWDKIDKFDYDSLVKSDPNYLESCPYCFMDGVNYEKHKTHGLGTTEDGPEAPDCPCRETDKQKDCARAGCGFCRATPLP